MANNVGPLQAQNNLNDVDNADTARGNLSAVGTADTDASGFGFVTKDGTLSGDSDALLPTEKASKTYVDTRVRLTPETVAGTAYTPVLADADAKMKQTSSASTVTVTIPANADVPFEPGAILNFQQNGGGIIVFEGAAGVAINPIGGAAQTYTQFSTAQLIQGDTVDEWTFILNGAPGYRWGSRQVFDIAGTWTYTRPAGCRAAFVRLVGSGCGGDGVAAGGEAQGGSAGGYSEKFITNLNPTETVIIPDGGAGGTPAAPTGLPGGTASFGAHCSATGGTRTEGGIGSGGDVNGQGQHGFPRITTTDGVSGMGGASHFSGGGAAGLSSGSHNGEPGMNGSGGGGGRDGLSVGVEGGKGGIALCIVDEYY